MARRQRMSWSEKADRALDRRIRKQLEEARAELRKQEEARRQERAPREGFDANGVWRGGR